MGREYLFCMVLLFMPLSYDFPFSRITTFATYLLITQCVNSLSYLPLTGSKSFSQRSPRYGVVLIYQIIHRLHKHRIYLDRLWIALDHLWIVLDRLTSSPPNYHSKVFFLMILRRFQPLAFTQVYNILCTCAYFIYIASPE